MIAKNPTTAMTTTAMIPPKADSSRDGPLPKLPAGTSRTVWHEAPAADANFLVRLQVYQKEGFDVEIPRGRHWMTVTFSIVAGVFGQSRSSRSRAAILSTTSSPVVTFPK